MYYVGSRTIIFIYKYIKINKVIYHLLKFVIDIILINLFNLIYTLEKISMAV